MDRDFLKKLYEVVEAHLSDPSFTARNLALKLGMSHSSLLRKVKSATGKTINQLIREMRLEKAQQLLKEDSHSLSEVAALSGFTSQPYFTACFRKQYGYTPGAIQSNQNGNAPVETQNFASHDGETPNPNKSDRSKNIIITCSALIIISAAILIFLFASGRIVNDKSIAVLPLRSNSGTAEEAMQAEIIREQIITTLNQIQVFDVRSAASSAKYTPDVGMSNRKISRKLKVKYLIEGSVSTQDSLWLSIQMIRGKNDDHFGAEDYYLPESGTEKNNKMLKMAEHVAYELNTELKPDERSAIRIACSKSDESMENYRLGKSHMNFQIGVEPRKAIPFYKAAIELDPEWPSPYFGLADAYRVLFENDPKEEYMVERLKAIKKGHEVRPGLWSYRAFLSYYLSIGEWKTAIKWFKKARRKYPDNNNLGKMGRNFGLWNDALEMLNSVVYQQNPNDWQAPFALGETYEIVRDFPNAIKYYKKIKYINPDVPLNYYCLADIALKWNGDVSLARAILKESMERKPWKDVNAMQASYFLTILDIYEGNYQNAINQISKMAYPATLGRGIAPYYYRPKQILMAETYGYMGQDELEQSYYDSTRIYIDNQIEKVPTMGTRPGVISCLAMAHAGLGNTDKAFELIKQIEKMLSQSPDAFYSPFAMEDVAWIYTKTGNYKEALKVIRKLLSKPGPLTTKLLEIDPKWDALRDQPGSQKLIDKYGIPVVEITEDLPENVKQKTGLPEISDPTFIDKRDRKIFHYKKIGTQTWMTQNLSYLPEVNLPDSSSYTENRYYVYDYSGTSPTEARETDNYKLYGGLYNWSAATNACPEGWHLPSDMEWKTLESYLGMSEKEVDMTNEKLSGSVGKKIRYTSGWYNNGNGDNSSGFYGLPGGFLHFNHNFMDINKNVGWWTSTESDNSSAMIRATQFNTEGVFRISFDKRGGLSVRCVKDQ